MPNYAAQIPPADRWAIAAYIRALQLQPARRARGRPRRRARAAARAPSVAVPTTPTAHARDERDRPTCLDEPTLRRSAGIERPAAALAAGVVLLGHRRVGLVPRQRAVLPLLPARLPVLARPRGRLARRSLMLHHLTGGALGPRDPRRLRGRGAHAPAAGDRCCCRCCSALRRSIPGPDPRRRRDELLRKKAAYLNAAVLRRPRRRLLRGLERARVPAQRVVAAAGRHAATPHVRRACAALSAAGSCCSTLDHDLRRHRLGDVARAALVLDHLRRDLHRRPGRSAPSPSRSSCWRGSPNATAVRRRARARRRPRPRQAAVRLHDALGATSTSRSS